MTGATTPLVAGLPDRPDDVVAGLPDAFRPSQVDYLPSSICWYEDGWLISTDVWGDRRLARYETSRGSWTALPAPSGRAHGQRLARRARRGEVLADGIEESSVTDWNGLQVTCRDAGGHATAWAAGGEAVRVVPLANGAPAIAGPRWEIPIPAGATLTHLSPSPD